MATPEIVIDPFDTATEAKAPSAEYFGEIVLDAWHCVLEKGTGKRPFDPGADDPSTRRTAVDIVILPLAEMNLKFTLERKLVAESAAWTKITWPSLQKLGLTNAREAKNKFARVKLTPTGRKWTGQDGSEKEETTFEFVALFATEDECRAAFSGKHSTPAAAPAPAAVPGEDPNKKTALTFAKAVITNLARAEKDLVALQGLVAAKIASMPMVNQHYTADSPEIMQMIIEAVG